jgi:hypothetical protein
MDAELSGRNMFIIPLHKGGEDIVITNAEILDNIQLIYFRYFQSAGMFQISGEQSV